MGITPAVEGRGRAASARSASSVSKQLTPDAFAAPFDFEDRQMEGKWQSACCAPHSGVLSLAKKYGTARWMTAALLPWKGRLRIRFVRRLERNPRLLLILRQVDPLIRQLTLYGNFIQDKTKESQTRPYDNSGSTAWRLCSKTDCIRPKPNPWYRSI
jgi:hypothetical protein